MATAATSTARAGLMEEVIIVSGLIAVQLIAALYTLFLHRFLNLGINSLSLVIFGGLASALLLLPFALILEKKRWPAKLRALLIVQMLVAALGGTTAQVLMMDGIKMTSAEIASSMPNLVPAIIFVIAACVRFEKFSIWCKYSRAKVIGTVLCMGGAMAMSFLMSPPPSHDSSSSTLHASITKEWILGCLYLLLAMVLVSCNVVLHAAVMVNFPPLSMCVVTAAMSSIFAAMLQFVTQGNLDVGSSSLSLEIVAGIVILGAVVSSICFGFQMWCIKKKGPVMVSLFNPVQTVFSAVLSAYILGQVINLGSLAGMLLMFVGLYIVLWAKKKEECGAKDGGNNESDPDIEKPLLK